MIQLENEKIKAKISPEMGMALTSLKIHDTEILNQDLKDNFIRTRKGLGPIILPHFNQVSPIAYKDTNPDDELYKVFPHIQHLRELGILHPFQHGIGRYVAWTYQIKKNTIIGYISGNDKVNRIKLKDLNGFDFNAKVIYKLFQDYINIELDVSGDMPVASGIHFYYDLVNNKSKIYLNAYHNNYEVEIIALNENHDDILIPVADENGLSRCLLQTSRYNLLTEFIVKGSSNSVFESLIIFSNTEKNFVCIEPLSYKVGTKNTKLNHNGVIKLIPLDKFKVQPPTKSFLDKDG